MPVCHSYKATFESILNLEGRNESEQIKQSGKRRERKKENSIQGQKRHKMNTPQRKEDMTEKRTRRQR